MVLPRRRPDPDPARRRERERARARVGDRGARRPAACSASIPRARAPATGYLHRGHTGVARLALRTGTADRAGRADRHRRGAAGRQADAAPVPPGDDPLRRAARPRALRRLEQEHLALRELTDEVMYEIGQLSGYEYVDTYATKKAEDIPTEVAHVASFDEIRTPGDRRVLVDCV